VANLPEKPTYTNKTFDAQIQISPLAYNLGQRIQRGEKRGGSGCRDERRRGEKAPISQLTHSLEYEHVYGEGRGNLDRLEQTCTCSLPLAIVGSQVLVLLASPYTPDKSVPVIAVSDNFLANNREEVTNIFKLNISMIYTSKDVLILNNT
jgi:hypothetical protein